MAQAGRRTGRGQRWRHRVMVAVAALALVGGSWPTVAAATASPSTTTTTQGITWTRAAPVTSPPPLSLAAMGYDPDTHQIVLDGGELPAGVDFPNTWVWNGTTWAESNSHGIIGGESMAYDAATGQLLAFGGFAQPYLNFYSNATYEWNGNGWTQLSPATSPPPQWGGSMAYDAATRQLVLLGTSSQTWQWNGTTWTKAHPATTPPVTSGGSMGYDAATGQLVLFGGGTATAPSSAETWTWNGTTWTRLSPATSPPAVSFASMAYDAAAGRLVLLANNGDTWTWNGATWAEAATTGPGPDSEGSMAYDASSGQMVLYGGTGNAQGETWLIGRPVPACSRIITTAFSGPLTVTGSTCVEKGGSVNGSVTVKPGGALTVTDGAINGPLTATGAARIELCGASLAGTVTLANTIGPLTVGGGLPGVTCAADQISGSLTVTDSSPPSCLPGTACTPPVTIGPATIAGPVQLSGNTAGVTMTHVTMSGPLTATANLEAPFFGPVVHVVFDDNTISGPVTLNDNDSLTVSANTIYGNLACTANTPAPGDAGSPNTVSGPATGQCAHLAGE